MTLRLLALPANTRQCLFQHLCANTAKFSTARSLSIDPRLKELGNVFQDEFSVLRDNYQAPKYPIILAHGLLGFDELHLAGQRLPGIQYWRGIREALSKAGVEVITATVPPSGSLEARAARLGETIAEKAHGKSVNIIACVHSSPCLNLR